MKSSRSFGSGWPVLFANFLHLCRTDGTGAVSPRVANVGCKVGNLLITQLPTKRRHMVWPGLLLCCNHRAPTDDDLQNCGRGFRLYVGAALEWRKDSFHALSALEVTTDAIGCVESLAAGKGRPIAVIDLDLGGLWRAWQSLRYVAIVLRSMLFRCAVESRTTSAMGPTAAALAFVRETKSGSYAHCVTVLFSSGAGPAHAAGQDQRAHTSVASGT